MAKIKAIILTYFRIKHRRIHRLKIPLSLDRNLKKQAISNANETDLLFNRL